MIRHGLRAMLALTALTSLGAPAVAQPQAQVTAQWFAGTWSDSADCRAPIHFLSNGQYFTPAGAEGRWRIEGNVLVLANREGGGERRMTVERLGQNTARASNVTSYRCEGRSPGN